MKPCPYCAESIQDSAVKCRFCGEFLHTPTTQTAPQPQVMEGGKTHLQNLKAEASIGGKNITGKLQFEGSNLFIKTFTKRVHLFDLANITSLEHASSTKLTVILGKQVCTLRFRCGTAEALVYKKTFALLSRARLVEWKPDHKKTAIIIISITAPITVLILSIILFRFFTVLNSLVLVLAMLALLLGPVKKLFGKVVTLSRKSRQWLLIGAAVVSALSLAISISSWVHAGIEEAKHAENVESVFAQANGLIAQREYKQALDTLLAIEATSDQQKQKSRLVLQASDGLYDQYLAQSKALLREREWNSALTLMAKINRKWSRYTEVNAVNAAIAAGIEEDKREETKHNYIGSFSLVQEKISAAKSYAVNSQWLAADKEYGRTLALLDKIEAQSKTWLGEFVPADYEMEKERTKILDLRKKISPQVEKLKRKAEHEERLAWIESVKSDLEPANKRSYLSAKSRLEAEIEKCGKCRTSAQLKKALRKVEKTLADWPIAIGSIREMKTRYADLKGYKVSVSGYLATSTYYNCRFGSQSRYRSFEFSDGLIGGIHVYCSRGDEGCETIFQSLAAGGSSSGTAVLEYPKRNHVCEEGQAYLLEWR